MRAPALSLITDEPKPLDELADVVARACGAARNERVTTAVQLRWKNASGRALFSAARRLREVTRGAGALLVVNDRIDIALAAGADGVHLPATGMSSPRARRLLGPEMLLGRSVHSLAEVERERDAGAVDYLQFGPVFATPAKTAFGPPQGLPALARAVGSARPLPVIAVGGIARTNLAGVMQAGAAGAAVIGAVMRAEDPHDAAQMLARALADLVLSKIRG